MAVKLLEHCETVTLLVEDECLLDLGPDHPPSPSGFLRLLKGTRLRQLTVKLVDPDRSRFTDPVSGVVTHCWWSWRNRGAQLRSHGDAQRHQEAGDCA